MNFIPKADARIELDAIERATFKEAGKILKKIYEYCDEVEAIENDDATVILGDSDFLPNIDCFTFAEMIDILDDFGNEDLSIRIR